MTKFIAVVSAKGGVGKTTTSINLSSALDWFKRDVIVMDANFANPDVGVHLGAPLNEKTTHSALKGNHHINESIYRHPSGLKVIPGDMSYDEARKAQKKNLLNVVLDLTNSAEVVIIDSTPGLGLEARSVIKAIDYVIIVTTPDICSVTNSIKMVKLAKDYDKQVLGVVVNKIHGDEMDLPVENIETIIGAKVLGVIPHDKRIKKAFHTRNPVVITHPEAEPSLAYKRLASELIGEKYVESLTREEEFSLFGEAMKKLGFSR